MAKFDSNIYNSILANWDRVAKPLDGMGAFEKLTARIGAVQKSIHPSAEKSALLVICADNGIVEEGISQSDQSVTGICAANIAAGTTTVGIMAANTDTDIIAADFGIAVRSDLPGDNRVLDYSIRKGTRNFLKEPAMTEAEVMQAIENGRKLVGDCADAGYRIICIGEMGIGNTTTSAAVTAALLGLKAEEATGRGAGLDDNGLKRKISAVRDALEKYNLYEADTLTILRTVGGFDIAGMVGVYLGAAERGVPVILDGAISMVAALIAEKLNPGIKDFLIPSHLSREPVAGRISKELGLKPVIHAEMALGEGTGAVLMLGLIKTAIDVYEKSVPFDDSGVDQYTRYES